VASAAHQAGELAHFIRLAVAGSLTKEHLPAAREIVRGRVLRLSKDPSGCFLVQSLLDLAEKATQKEMVAELRGHVAELVESQHGNFVLQKAVEKLPPPTVAFVLQELQAWGSPRRLAQHKYGCRVLERLIEHFPPSEIGCFIDDILSDLDTVSKDSFGNFVVQHILEHGDGEHRRRVARWLGNDIRAAALETLVVVLDLLHDFRRAASDDGRSALG